MCFSPEVSFGSATALIGTGVYCWRTAKRKCPRLWPIAVVPGLFGLQQAVEGMVWLGLNAGNETLTRVASQVYLFFALAFWPIWFCIAAALIEYPGPQRKFLAAWAVLSFGWLIGYLPVLTNVDGRTAHVCHHSIRYDYPDDRLGGPVALWAVRGLYLVTATVPYFAYSALKLTVVPVTLGLAAAVVAAVAYDHAYTSVWCLYAAVLSVSLVWAIRTAPRRA